MADIFSNQISPSFFFRDFLFLIPPVFCPSCERKTRHKTTDRSAWTTWHCWEHNMLLRHILLYRVPYKCLYSVSFCLSVCNNSGSEERIIFWDLRSPGILRSLKWWSRTDVSGQPISPIFRGPEVQGPLTLARWRLLLRMEKKFTFRFLFISNKFSHKSYFWPVIKRKDATQALTQFYKALLNTKNFPRS